MSFLSNLGVETQAVHPVDYDANNDLIMTQTDDGVQLYTSDGRSTQPSAWKLASPPMQQSYHMNLRFAPGQLEKVAVAISDSTVQVFNGQSKRLSLKFSGLFKKDTVRGVEWLSSQLLVVVLSHSAQCFKILWAKTDAAPLADQQVVAQFTQPVKHYQVMTGMYLIAYHETSVSVIQIVDKPRLKIAWQTEQRLVDSREQVAYLLRPQGQRLFSQTISDNIAMQEQLGHVSQLNTVSSTGVFRQNLAISGAPQTQEALIVFSLTHDSIKIVHMGQGKVVGEAKIPGVQYSQLFLCDSFLYVLDPETHEMVCFDILNKQGGLALRPASENARLQGNSGVGQMAVAFLQRLGELGVEKGSFPKIKAPLILQLNMQQMTQRVGILRVDARQLLRALGTPRCVADLLQLYYVGRLRSDGFVEPFLEALREFLQTRPAENLTQLFCLLLNSTFELRAAKQLSLTMAPFLIQKSGQPGGSLGSESESLYTPRLAQPEKSSAGEPDAMLHGCDRQTTGTLRASASNHTVKLSGKQLVWPRGFYFSAQELITLVRSLEPRPQVFYATQLLCALRECGLCFCPELLVQLLGKFSVQEIMVLHEQSLVPRSSHAAHLFAALAERRGGDKLLARVAVRLYRTYGMPAPAEEVRKQFQV